MSEFTLPSDEKSRKSIVAAIKEASNSKTRIDAERDLIKEIAARVKEEQNMPPALFNSLVSAYHKQDLDKKQEKTEEFFDTYSVLFPSN
jgi:hypothetical protein